MGHIKTCSKCEVEKPIGEFNKCNKAKDGYQYYCKVCSRKRGLVNYQRNRQARLDRFAARYAKDRDFYLRKAREHRRKNPQAIAVVQSAQRSPLTEKELFAGAERADVREETAFIYRLCRLITNQTGVAHHIDHIIPLSKGGVHREWNLRILPASENLSKADKFDDEWFNATDEDIERLEAEALAFTPRKETP